MSPDSSTTSRPRSLEPHSGHSGGGRLSALILIIYECWMEHLFVLSWARVRRIVLWSDVR